MLFRSIRSLLPAKKAAITSPNMPPRPKTQAFFLLPFLFFPFCFSVCSCSAVITRKFDGRSFAFGGAGEGSRDGSDDVSPPLPKRRLRKDMAMSTLRAYQGQGEFCCGIEALAHVDTKTSELAGMHVMQCLRPTQAHPTATNHTAQRPVRAGDPPLRSASPTRNTLTSCELVRPARYGGEQPRRCYWGRRAVLCPV